MHFNTSEHPYLVNSERISTRRKTSHLLFGAMDDLGGVQKLVRDTQSEIDEFKAELEAPVYNKVNADGEWIDAWNVLNATGLKVLGSEFDPRKDTIGVNGEAKLSNIFDRVEERTADIQDDPKAIREVARLLESLRMHQTSIQPEALLPLFDKADQKFKSNYPERYYAGFDHLTGKPIPAEFQETAFTHFTKALKMIRANVQKILDPQDYLPFDSMILNWRNSQFAISELKLVLDMQDKITYGISQQREKIARPTVNTTFQINRTKKSGILYSAS